MATQAFFEDCDVKLAELADAKVEVARDAIKRAAHAIKGAAATIALVEIAALARTLEASAGTIAQAELEATVTALKRATDAAHADMRVLVPGLAG
jgi:HPt (histidine-containing phosphotransfer) domain-containing protein